MVAEGQKAAEHAGAAWPHQKLARLLAELAQRLATAECAALEAADDEALRCAAQPLERLVNTALRQLRMWSVTGPSAP